MDTQKICPVCGNEETKQGKLHGVAALHALDARVGVGGSELIFTFCSQCGEVLSVKVDNPDAIK
jgi:thymidine kinase